MKLHTISRVTNNLLNIVVNYVIITSKRLNIDESHALKHSIDVFNYANNIVESKIQTNPILNKQRDVISVSSLLHDMCDSKYILNEPSELNNIDNILIQHMNDKDRMAVSNIISTMSYSKVKKNGYPNLHEYQDAYHIVREADLLSGFDINRCIIFGLKKENLEYTDAVKRAIDLYDSRMSKYIEDDLFISEYAIKKANELNNQSKYDISVLQKLIF